MLVLTAQVTAFGWGEVVFHHDAVEVVGLVLEAASQRAGALDRDRLTELVLPVTASQRQDGPVAVAP